MDSIKKELDARRNKVKEEFENRMQEAERKAEYYRKRIDAHKKERDAKIDKIEKNLGKKAAAMLKKRLGEKDYRRLHEWLLKKKKEKIEKTRQEVQPTEDEDYQTQLAQMNETDPRELALYYLNNRGTLNEALKREEGIDV